MSGASNPLAPLTGPQWQDWLSLAGRPPERLTATERARVAYYCAHAREREEMHARQLIRPAP